MAAQVDWVRAPLALMVVVIVASPWLIGAYSVVGVESP
jgi:hypothetical protein